MYWGGILHCADLVHVWENNYQCNRYNEVYWGGILHCAVRVKRLQNFVNVYTECNERNATI